MNLRKKIAQPAAHHLVIKTENTAEPVLPTAHLHTSLCAKEGNGVCGGSARSAVHYAGGGAEEGGDALDLRLQRPHLLHGYPAHVRHPVLVRRVLDAAKLLHLWPGPPGITAMAPAGHRHVGTLAAPTAPPGSVGLYVGGATPAR